jgi:AbrB family looped-hinge helix DNA binding protein
MLLMDTSKVSEKGQTTIPKAIRELLNVSPGDVIQYCMTNGTIQLKRLVTSEDSEWETSLSTTMTEWESADDDDL